MGLYLTHRLVKLYYDEIGDESEFVTGGFFVYSTTELATNNPHLKPHLAFYIPVCSDVYSSSINVPEHFTIIFYGKLEYSFKQNFYKNKI